MKPGRAGNPANTFLQNQTTNHTGGISGTAVQRSQNASSNDHQ